MAKINELEKIIKNEEAKIKSDPNYVDLKTFLEEMQDSGFSIKKSYSLPQTDTIGKKYNESIKLTAKTEKT